MPHHPLATHQDNELRPGRRLRAALFLLAAAGLAAIAYAGFGRPVPRDPIGAVTPAPSGPLIRAPSAAPPKPMPQARPLRPYPPRRGARPSPNGAPTPAPLAAPSRGAPPQQTIDVDPKTPTVLTPIPERVAPGAN